MSPVLVAAPDARSENWELLLPPARAWRVVAGDPPAPGAAPVEAVVVPDLAAWAPGLRTAAVLAGAQASVAPHGRLVVGFPAARPGLPGRSRGLSLAGACRRLHRAGFVVDDCYATLPSHHHPAVLVPLSGRGPLDDALQRLPATFVAPGARAPRLARHARRLARWAALRAPQPLRVRLLPGFLLTAHRTP